jgi:hypothetical protein
MENERQWKGTVFFLSMESVILVLSFTTLVVNPAETEISGESVEPTQTGKIGVNWNRFISFQKANDG